MHAGRLTAGPIVFDQQLSAGFDSLGLCVAVQTAVGRAPRRLFRTGGLGAGLAQWSPGRPIDCLQREWQKR